MKIAIVAITKRGKTIASKIKRFFPDSKIYITEKLAKPRTFSKSLKALYLKKVRGKGKGLILFEGKLVDLARRLFAEFEGIIFCMAMGIVVRAIAPYIKDKHTDPAVVVVDDEARFAISALSGHEGGANSLAIRVGNILGAEPVVTTFSESKKKIVIGIGCKRGIKREEVIKAVGYALARVRCSIDKVRYISTIDLKQNELGLKKACLSLGVPLRIISSDMIKNFNGAYQRSFFVKEKIGVEGVSEPCALLTARKPKLILPKIKVGMVTVAVAKEC